MVDSVGGGAAASNVPPLIYTGGAYAPAPQPSPDLSSALHSLRQLDAHAAQAQIESMSLPALMQMQSEIGGTRRELKSCTEVFDARFLQEQDANYRKLESATLGMLGAQLSHLDALDALINARISALSTVNHSETGADDAIEMLQLRIDQKNVAEACHELVALRIGHVRMRDSGDSADLGSYLADAHRLETNLEAQVEIAHRHTLIRTAEAIEHYAEIEQLGFKGRVVTASNGRCSILNQFDAPRLRHAIDLLDLAGRIQEIQAAYSAPLESVVANRTPSSRSYNLNPIADVTKPEVMQRVSVLRDALIRSGGVFLAVAKIGHSNDHVQAPADLAALLCVNEASKGVVEQIFRLCCAALDKKFGLMNHLPEMEPVGVLRYADRVMQNQLPDLRASVAELQRIDPTTLSHDIAKLLESLISAMDDIDARVEGIPERPTRTFAFVVRVKADDLTPLQENVGAFRDANRVIARAQAAMAQQHPHLVGVPRPLAD